MYVCMSVCVCVLCVYVGLCVCVCVCVCVCLCVLMWAYCKLQHSLGSNRIRRGAVSIQEKSRIAAMSFQFCIAILTDFAHTNASLRA